MIRATKKSGIAGTVILARISSHMLASVDERTPTPDKVKTSLTLEGWCLGCSLFESCYSASISLLNERVLLKKEALQVDDDNVCL
ncbi:MAG: hypothetical protein KBD55_02210 [Candidatus Pacebacteria bacterium]|jgi:pantothenate kinase-related protein Tda10|nr:hypothetical protein [Candidatus Paceibacterota bacterium]